MSRNPSSRTSHQTAVLLNIYDLHPANSYGLYQLGFGAHHSGVEVNGTEYAYGGHDGDSTGVYNHEPRGLPELARQQGQEVEFRESMLIGYSNLSHSEIRSAIDRLSGEFVGNSYNVLSWNCNTFADRLCRELLSGKGIPTWVNRLAWLGNQFVCLFPTSWGLSGPSPEQAEVVPLFPGAGQPVNIAPAWVSEINEQQRREIMRKAAERRVEQ